MKKRTNVLSVAPICLVALSLVGCSKNSSIVISLIAISRKVKKTNT